MTEYELWDKGKMIGKKLVIATTNGILIVAEHQPLIEEMVSEAAKDGVRLTLAAGFRTWEKQYQLRQAHVIDKERINDDKWIRTADPGQFYPRTARPGESNHQDGTAYDFNLKTNPKAYKWMKFNAIRFGFVRTVASEIWHWEVKPHSKQYDFVPRDHSSWKV